jgi:DMSO/TMAO reductase YedYZ molybdopterin-dependent catalytic subunit
MKRRLFAIAFATIFSLSLVIAGIVFTVNKAGFGNNVITKDLQTVEITDYEGKDLSSVNDFRENSIKGPQYVDIATYELEVTSLVGKPLSLTYDDVLDNYQHYRKVVRLDCVEGWSANILWKGVLVRDILNEAGVLPEAKTIILHAYDEYTTSFPIDYIMGNDIIMAYKMNEIIMPPERGYPFQLVAESKWGYKWIKWITQIELSDNEHYRGYWESRGYSNSADLDESFFDFKP